MSERDERDQDPAPTRHSDAQRVTGDEADPEGTRPAVNEDAPSPSSRQAGRAGDEASEQ